MVGGGEGKGSSASRTKRIKELEEQLGISKKEEAALSSSHRHASLTRSDRGDGGSNRPTRTDHYMDQVVDSEAFLIAAFQTGDGPFLPVKVAAADAPFVNVLLSLRRHGRADRGMSSTARSLAG
jgi:hypothetical protein